MQAKVLEIRDRATFVPALAVLVAPDNEGQRYLMRRCGYAFDGEPNVILTNLAGGGAARSDPYDWGDRTMAVAHLCIIKNWSTLSDGDVVCVEHFLGERAAPKVSERLGG